MPPILLSPLVKWSLAALGGAMVVHWVVKEARRINEELDNAKRVRVRDSRSGKSPDLAARSGAPANIGPRLATLSGRGQRPVMMLLAIAGDQRAEEQRQQTPVRPVEKPALVFLRRDYSFCCYWSLALADSVQYPVNMPPDLTLSGAADRVRPLFTLKNQ